MTSTDEITGGYRLTNISSKAYEHPADRAATAALAQIPMLDVVLKKLIELQYARAVRQSYLGNSVLLGPNQLPRVWNLHNQVCRTLDLPGEYELYLAQMPIANAVTIGAGKPIVVVNSGLVELLDDARLRVVLAHEAGHILSEHVLYRTALITLLRIGGSVRLPFFAGLPVMAVRSALLEWWRAAELTCDRAAALAVRDPLVVCKTLMALAAGAAADELDLDAWMAQGQAYDEGGPFDKASRLFLELGATHSFSVRRTHELMTWVGDGDYDRIVGGEFTTRDEAPNARAEAGDAVSFYSDKFRAMFREAGDAVGGMGQQVADWVRGGGSGEAGGEASGSDDPESPRGPGES